MLSLVCFENPSDLHPPLVLSDSALEHAVPFMAGSSAACSPKSRGSRGSSSWSHHHLRVLRQAADVGRGGPGQKRVGEQRLGRRPGASSC